MILVKSHKFTAPFTLGSLCSLGRYVYAAQHLLYHVYLTMSWLLFISVFHFCGAWQAPLLQSSTIHSLSYLGTAAATLYCALCVCILITWPNFLLQGFSPSQLHSTVLIHTIAHIYWLYYGKHVALVLRLTIFLSPFPFNFRFLISCIPGGTSRLTFMAKLFSRLCTFSAIDA